MSALRTLACLGTTPSQGLQLSIRKVDRGSYYDLIGTIESCWRAFQATSRGFGEERGIVSPTVRFGLKAGAKSQNIVTSNDRLVGEFFTA